jgi:undecaprenyl-diphosphatase
MRKILFVCFHLALAFHGYGQSVYTFDWKKDALIGTLSLGVFASPFFINNEPDQIPASWDKNDINGFDRSIMFPYNKTIDLISDYGVYGLLTLPVISLIGNIDDTNAWLTYGIMYSEAFLATFGTKDLLKNAIVRYRPYTYENGVPRGKEDDYYNSFPSGSTALAFLSATFLSTTFSSEYPESKWKIPVIAGSYTLAAGIASMRIVSGSHFLSDVFVGAAIGSLCGWLLPFLHTRQNEKNNLTINFTGNGISVSIKQ